MRTGGLGPGGRRCFGGDGGAVAFADLEANAVFGQVVAFAKRTKAHLVFCVACSSAGGGAPGEAGRSAARMWLCSVPSVSAIRTSLS